MPFTIDASMPPTWPSQSKFSRGSGALRQLDDARRVCVPEVHRPYALLQRKQALVDLRPLLPGPHVIAHRLGRLLRPARRPPRHKFSTNLVPALTARGRGDESIESHCAHPARSTSDSLPHCAPLAASRINSCGPAGCGGSHRQWLGITCPDTGSTASAEAQARAGAGAGGGGATPAAPRATGSCRRAPRSGW